MMGWAASSELIVMVVVLAFLVAELINIRRTLKRDRAKAEDQRKSGSSDG